MSSTNRGGQRLADDWYETPEWCTRLILPHTMKVQADCPLIVREPAAGRGAIKRVLRETHNRYVVYAVELDPVRAEESGAECADFLSKPWPTVDLTITNPPFSIWQEFAEHCIATSMVTALLLRIAVVASKKRREFWERHPADMYVLSRRPSFTDNGKCDSADYAWFVWGPGRGNRWSRLEA